MDAPKETMLRHRMVNGVRTVDEVARYQRGERKRKYINARQCAAVFKRDARRCSWYAKKDSLYCKRHQGNHHPSNEEARKQGYVNWWVRMRAIEKEHPGTMRRVLNMDQRDATKAKTKEIEATLLPRPKTTDKIIIKAHKALVKQVAALPAIPDKPFDELAPHEQLVFNTRLALKRSHEILEIKLTEKKMTDNPKLAAMVKDAAFRTLATSVKVDSNTLQARKLDRMGELLQRLKSDGSDAKLIEG